MSEGTKTTEQVGEGMDDDAQAPTLRVGPLWIFEGRYHTDDEFRGGRHYRVIYTLERLAIYTAE